MKWVLLFYLVGHTILSLLLILSIFVIAKKRQETEYNTVKDFNKECNVGYRGALCNWCCNIAYGLTYMENSQTHENGAGHYQQDSHYQQKTFHGLLSPFDVLDRIIKRSK